MELSISGPRNAFPLPSARRYILVAGGIGVTPLLSMMRRLQRNKADWQLHYYARDPEQAPFGDMLRQAPYRDHVRFYQSLRREGCPPPLGAPSSDTAVMLCGPDAS